MMMTRGNFRDVAAVLAGLALAAGCGKKTDAVTPDAGATDNGFVCADHAGMGAKVGSLASAVDFRECFVRTQESAAGNLVLDGLFWGIRENQWSADITQAAKDARFYIDNSGTMQIKNQMPKGEICEKGYISKTNPGEGDLSTGKAFTDAVLPFQNSLILVTMPQSKLRQVLERSFAINESATPTVDFPNKDGSMLIVSANVKITVDFTDYVNKAQKYKKPATTRPGALITKMTVDGTPIDLTSDQPITFVTSNFVAGVDIEGGKLKAGTVAGKGGGVAAGFSSDYFTNDQLPATNTFVILDEGKDPKAATTLTETAILRKYFAAHPALDPKVSARYEFLNNTRELNLCQ